MGLKIIAGRAGAGKTSVAISQIVSRLKGNPEKPTFLIVPEQFTIQAERRLLGELPGEGLLDNEVLSFRRMAYRIFSRYGGLAKPSLHRAGRLMLLSHTFRLLSGQLSYYQAYCDRPWDVDKIMELLEEFTRYGVAPEDILQAAKTSEGEISLKLTELGSVFSRYRQLLSEEYIDESDVHKALIEKLNRHRPFSGAALWLDAFSGFTTLEFEIITCLIQQCESVTVCLACDRSSDPVFSGVRRTLNQLREIAEASGCPVEIQYLSDSDLPRFRESPVLAHLERYYTKYPCVPYTGSADQIQIAECKDIHSEVLASALEIHRLCRCDGLRYKDICVAVRDAEPYKATVRAVYPLLGIPFFLDDKVSADKHPLTGFILDALDIVAGNWRYDSVFSFLKSGFYTDQTELVDRLENIVLAVGIRGKSAWNKSFIPPETVDGESLEVLRHRFMDDLDFLYEGFRSAQVLADAIRVLCDFLGRMDIPGKMKQLSDVFRQHDLLAEADEYARIWNITMEVFEQLYHFLGEEPCGGIATCAETLGALLRSGFSKHMIGALPQSADCVQFGTADRSRTQEIKALILLGANEGEFPRSFSDNGILSDEERALLSEWGITLSEDLRTRAFLEQYLIYNLLSQPEKYLFVSYHLEGGGGEAARPSMIIRRLKTLFPDIEIRRDYHENIYREAVLRELMRKNAPVSELPKVQPDQNPTYEVFLPPEVAAELFCMERKITMSASRLERYHACPFMFYLEYGLDAKPREEFSVENFDIGTLMHGLLNKACRRLFSEDIKNKEITYEYCADIIASVAEETLAEMGRSAMTGTARNQFLTKRLTRYTVSCLHAIALQSQSGEYVPSGFEVPFGMDFPGSLPPVQVKCPTGELVSLRGVIDRFDAWSHGGKIYFRVVDYKSTEHQVKPGEIISGHKVQLITYLDALLSSPSIAERDAVGGGALYFTLQNDTISLNKREDLEKKTVSYDMTGMVYDSPENLRAMAGENNRGGISVKSKDGEITLGSKYTAVPDGGFDFLRNRMHAAIGETVSKMRSGHIEIAPKEANMKSACTYCKYNGICGFEGTPKPVHQIADEEVWDLKNREN